MKLESSMQRLTMYYLLSSIEKDLRSFFAIKVNKDENIIDDILLNKLKERSKDAYDIESEHLHLVEFLDFSDYVNLLPKIKSNYPDDIQQKFSL